MKIKAIEADNFKLFHTKLQEMEAIDKADLVLLNGPNGYGKTSIFDIIEFCITGEIKRILKYNQELAIPKNEAYGSKILIPDEMRPTYVKIVYEEDGTEIGVMYDSPNGKKKSATQENNPCKFFESFRRHIFCDGQEVNEQADFLRRFQLDEISEIFDKCCFLSQDEHLQFLKEAKKSKAEALSFLFGIPEKLVEEQQKLDAVLDSLGNRRKKKEPPYIVRLEQKEDLLKKEMEGMQKLVDSIQERFEEEREIPYRRLFECRKIVWDLENAVFDEGMFEAALDEIESLHYFAEHREDCVKYLYNLPLKDLGKEFVGREEIVWEDGPLEYAYRFYGLIKQADELEERYSKEKKYWNALEVIQQRRYEAFNWEFIREENLFEEMVILEIQGKLNEVKSLEQTQSIMSKTMSSLQSAREDLLKHARNAMQLEGLDDSICPLCGASYSDFRELDEKIAQETKVLASLLDDSGVKIRVMKDELYTKYFEGLMGRIRKKLESPVSEELYQKLQAVKKNKSRIYKLENFLRNIGIDLPEKYSEDLAETAKGYGELADSIKKKRKEVPEDIELQLEDKNFIGLYDKFYDKNEAKFMEMCVEDLDRKKDYVKFLYYSSYHKKLQEKEEELNRIEDRKKQLVKIMEELKGYKKALSEGIREYQRKIIGDIEPLLYVYTAKILQQKFNGKSIFIAADEKVENIQLVNSINDEQDILFIMSSGQLSAVALSFLLCMNQVYAKHSLCSVLLIDDPVQTIDDVNMVGFVDILRHEFADRQIFVSTHEQKFERFLRYRYAKAGKSVKIYNMKEIMLQEK